MADGKSIVSGWSDGKIRAFLPQSGKLFYVINDAHNHGVTTTAVTNDCSRVVSGGMEGEVRIWKIGMQTQIMECSLKEHRGRVSDIRINKNDDQAVSASYDGSCIVWDLITHTRLTCFYESTMFKQVLYHPDESQLLTAGSDRKITYWDCFDGQAIRMLDGSDSGEINALAITNEGEHCVSGSEDKKVKIWDYDEGICYWEGIGHSGGISRVAISPDQKYIVSVGTEGAIFMWHMPENIAAAKADSEMPEMPPSDHAHDDLASVKSSHHSVAMSHHSEHPSHHSEAKAPSEHPSHHSQAAGSQNGAPSHHSSHH
jgi:WD40 repeat protein